MRAARNSCASLAGLVLGVLSFIACFILLVITPLAVSEHLSSGISAEACPETACSEADKASYNLRNYMRRMQLYCTT